MSESNGKSVSNGIAATVDEKRPQPAPYRPQASTAKVHQAIESGFRDIVTEANTQAGHFAYLAWADREQGTAIVYGHLVDAMECLEIAITHLGLLKTSVSHRLRVEDDANARIDDVPGDHWAFTEPRF